MQLPDELKKMLQFLQKLPGVGRKSAERYIFNLLEWPEPELIDFAQKIHNLAKNITRCSECGCIQDRKGCSFCLNSTRDPKLLCIVGNPKDIFAIEQTAAYLGKYFVLKNIISPLYGQTIDADTIEKIQHKICSDKVEEILLALDSTLEGDATALYLKKQLENSSLKISRLAFGVPIGSSLEYIDEGTLASALVGRRDF